MCVSVYIRKSTSVHVCLYSETDRINPPPQCYEPSPPPPSGIRRRPGKAPREVPSGIAAYIFIYHMCVCMYLYISDNMCLCMSASVSGADPGKPPARSPVLLRVYINISYVCLYVYMYASVYT